MYNRGRNRKSFILRADGLLMCVWLYVLKMPRVRLRWCERNNRNTILCIILSIMVSTSIACHSPSICLPINSIDYWLVITNHNANNNNNDKCQFNSYFQLLPVSTYKHTHTLTEYTAHNFAESKVNKIEFLECNNVYMFCEYATHMCCCCCCCASFSFEWAIFQMVLNCGKRTSIDACKGNDYFFVLAMTTK